MIVMWQPAKRSPPAARHAAGTPRARRQKPMRLPPRVPTPAFTLLELVLVLVIIGMLGALVIPRFSQAIAAQRVGAAARRIQADIALARRAARTGSSSRTIAFNQTTNSYTIAGIQNLDRAGSTYEVRLGEEPYRVTLATADLGGDGNLVFNGYGVADTGGTIVIQAGRRAMRITVETLTGRTSVATCLPVLLLEAVPALDEAFAQGIPD